MTGVALGLALLWAAWPQSSRLANTLAHPSLLVLPGLFAASLVYYLAPGRGLPAFAVFIVVASVASLLERRRSSREPRGPALRHSLRSVVVAGALIVWLAVNDIAAGGSPTTALLGLGAGLMLLLGILQSLRARVLTASIVVWWSAAFLAVALIAGGLLDREWTDCRYEFGKCTAVGRIYLGIFNSENTLAFFAALCGTLVLQAGGPRRRRRALLAILLLVVLLTGSRTPLAGLALLPVGMLLLRWTAVHGRGTGWRPAAAVVWAGSLAAAVVGLVIPWTARTDTFSLRGRLWSEMFSYVGPTSVTGLGRSSFVELLEQGHFRGHYPHSQYMLLLWFGGLAAIALHGAFVAVAWSGVTGSTRGMVARRSAPFIFLLVYGVAEVSWNPAGVDPNLWTVVVLIAAGASVPETGRPVVRPPAPAAGAVA